MFRDLFSDDSFHSQSFLIDSGQYPTVKVPLLKALQNVLVAYVGSSASVTKDQMKAKDLQQYTHKSYMLSASKFLSALRESVSLPDDLTVDVFKRKFLGEASAKRRTKKMKIDIPSLTPSVIWNRFVSLKTFHNNIFATSFKKYVVHVLLLCLFVFVFLFAFACF